MENITILPTEDTKPIWHVQPVDENEPEANQQIESEAWTSVTGLPPSPPPLTENLEFESFVQPSQSCKDEDEVVSVPKKSGWEQISGNDSGE